jgi:hypothetical protein
MTHGRNLVTTFLLAATMLLGGSFATEAQDDTPPPRMLLNLDLFAQASPAANQPGAPPNSGDSTIDQLRALAAMGYLNGDGPPPPDSQDDSNAPPINFIPKPQGEQQ